MESQSMIDFKWGFGRNVMSDTERKCLICNCEKTMPLDAAKLSKALGRDIGNLQTQLCRVQLENYEKALASDGKLLVACTQEAPLFQEIAEEHGKGHLVDFVNIREAAGWSDDAKKATPKIAALIEAADFVVKPARSKSIYSDGMCLVYGAGQQALEAAKLLSNKLSVTLMLSGDEDIILPTIGDVPIYRGTIKSAKGSFGEFEIIVDEYAPLKPATRGALNFAVARNGATSTCSVILDISGQTPLFPGHQHRDGYRHVDPGDPAAVLRAVVDLSEMVGEFEKPIYVDYNPDVCAHSRSKKIGCNKCLDVCPAGAILDAGDIVEIDDGICGGCGSCHSVCPTGAISYQYPMRSDVITHAQDLCSAFTNAGGKNPVLLIHDNLAGTEMVGALARFGKGLPAEVLPISYHSATALGHVEMLSILAGGAQRLLFLADPKKSEELEGLTAEVALANSFLDGLGLNATPRIEVLCENDPDVLETAIWAKPKIKPLKAEKFSVVGSKRDIMRLAAAQLHKQSKSKPEFIELPSNSPYGKLEIDQSACTLCMACTSACPAAAVTDTPGEPKLRFTQSACVQCGLCVNTCPEKALSLVPQFDFTPAAQQPVTLYEEEPFECISCGKPFATKSTIERISEQLAGKHSMFSDDERAQLIQMCDMCRIEAQANSSNDPFAVGDRPRPRTSQDYIDAESGKLSADDFLIDD